MLRYFPSGDDRLVVVGRYLCPWAIPLDPLLGALVASVFVVLHLDASGWLASAGFLAAASALLAPFAPPAGTAPRANEIDLAERTGGRGRLTITREAGAGWRLAVDGRELGWLTEFGRLASSRRRALHASAPAELHALAELHDEG